MELRSANPVGFGHMPISFSEMLAYSTLYDLGLDPFEIDTLRRLDALWLKLRPKQDDKPSG